MIWRDNPLLIDFWRRQLRPSTLHRSSLVSLSLGLVITAAVLLIGTQRGTPVAWVKVTRLCFALFAPGVTLAAVLSVGGTMLRWRRSGQLAAILQTPMSSSAITFGVLAPTVIGLGIFYTLLVLLVQWQLPSRFLQTNPGTALAYSEHMNWLWITIPDAWVQILYAATVTLWVSMRCRGVIALYGWSLAVAYVIPKFIVEGSVPEIFPGGREFLLIEADLVMLGPFKLAIVAVFLAELMTRLRKRCRLEGE